MKKLLGFALLLGFFLSALYLGISILTPEKQPDIMAIQEGYLKPVLDSVTPTPFQPVFDEVEKEVSEVLPISVDIVEPEILNPYELNGIDFGSQTPIEFMFATDSGEVFYMPFQPVLPTEPDDYRPGIGKAGVFADEDGNIAINPHSGCFRYSNTYEPLEGEYLRRYLEGGDCVDIFTKKTETEIEQSVESLEKGRTLVQQGESSTRLQVVGAGIIPFERLDEVKSMSPKELSALIGFTLDQRSVVIVTSGWDISHEPWYSAERWIVVLECID